MKKEKVFVDMDGVVADFEGRMKELNIDFKAAMIPGFYRTLLLYPGAKHGVNSLKEKYDVYFATTPRFDRPESILEKLEWLGVHFPWAVLEKKVIFTADKGSLHGKYLIDDHPEWSNAMKFKGGFIHFDGSWENCLSKIEYFEDQIESMTSC